MTKNLDIEKLNIDQLWILYSQVNKRLVELGEVKGKNIVGDRGEMVAVSFYNKTPSLPKLQLAPTGTQNIDAISTKGQRYSVKTISYPNRTTGVFHGYGSPQEPKSEKLFEFLIIVVLENFMPRLILEITWEDFYILKRWHSTMHAYNITLTKDLLIKSKIIFEQSQI